MNNNIHEKINNNSDWLRAVQKSVTPLQITNCNSGL